ncbi:hypothetical protein [Leeuwenhoekiella sp. H156]|uniref:hypothetical protein n=1 Tax=Leeuwenhoekiella sp. H156 TaxID=3450128 RepID=UPI003FA448B2
MKHIELINEFTSTLSEMSMNQLIDSAQNDLLEDTDILYLANKLANSGDQIVLPHDIITADIPSTGGPSSLSTLICPLVLREIGFIVPKLGVPGRPAGGIDILNQIPNYKIDYNKAELLKCLEKNGYCHFIANEHYTPADAKLFRHRVKLNATAVPALVIASILSKKIAVGLKITGLDIRVSKNGNFGNNLNQAIENANRFIKIAKTAGVNAICLISDLNFLQQPYIGRGESLLALAELFDGKPCDLLYNHFQRCISMSLELSNVKRSTFSIELKQIRSHFKTNILSQNGSWEGFINKSNDIKEKHSNFIYALSTGYLRIDLYQLKLLIVGFQNKYNSPANKFSDPCGVIFIKNDNELVEKGEAVLTFRFNYSEDFVKFRNGLLSCLIYKETKDHQFEYQVIR